MLLRLRWCSNYVVAVDRSCEIGIAVSRAARLPLQPIPPSPLLVADLLGLQRQLQVLAHTAPLHLALAVHRRARPVIGLQTSLETPISILQRRLPASVPSSDWPSLRSSSCRRSQQADRTRQTAARFGLLFCPPSYRPEKLAAHRNLCW